MPEQTTQPELIISLSRDKVNLQLLPSGNKGNREWQTSYSLAGAFASDEVSSIMDRALTSNPDLIDQFSCVHLVLLDRPSICMPSYLFENGKASEVAARHLRVRLGDQLSIDPASSRSMICYSIPDETMKVLREYYHDIGKTHIISLLWNAIYDRENSAQETNVMYVALIHNLLFILSIRNSKLVFSKSFEIRNASDIHYFAMACKKLLLPSACTWLKIKEVQAVFEKPVESYLQFDKEMELPSIPDLLAKYSPCVS